MKKLSKQQKVWLSLSVLSLVVFVVFTVIVALVDVDQVGLSHLNRFFWRACGRNGIWERLTDWIGYAVILSMVGLIVWQIIQWVMRKSLRRVDVNLLLMDLIFGCLVVVYLFFEIVVVNYRPELENGVAKASYPSSHAMLFATVLPLLIWQVWHYIQNKPWRIVLTVLLVVVLLIGVVGRLLSGVHWFTDILGGMLISVSFVCLYLFVVGYFSKHEN